MHLSGVKIPREAQVGQDMGVDENIFCDNICGRVWKYFQNSFRTHKNG